MVCGYLSSTFVPVGGLKGRLSAIIPDTWVFSDTVKGGLPPSPRRPEPTYLKCLILCAIWTLCSPAFSQSAERGATLKPLLTTSSMTCTALQKRSRSWYSEQPCSRTDLPGVIGGYAELWECRFSASRIIAYSFVPLLRFPGYCIQAIDTCMVGEWKVNVGWYKESGTSADTCFDI